MDERKQTEPPAEPDRQGIDPGPDTVDPAPWLGQVGEGATLPSGEAIAHLTTELTSPDDVDDDVEQVSADPEMRPIAPPHDRSE
jgi:hypothetical protein